MDQTTAFPTNNPSETSAINVAAVNQPEQPTKISNAVLQRLMEEVQTDNQNNISAYNRTHNRHNRGR